MKAVKFSVAAAAALALSTAAMAEGPVVYGQIGAEFGSIAANADDSYLQANYNASRLGVKGTKDLGNGMTALYQIESKVDPAAANGHSERTTYAGLKGDFGTVMIGNLDTPSKMVSRAAGLVVASDTMATLVQENARAVAGAYVLPVEGMTVAVAIANGAQSGVAAADLNNSTKAKEGMTIDAGVMLPVGDNLKVAVGFTSLPEGVKGDALTIIRAGATLAMGAMTVGAQVEMGDETMDILVPVNLKMDGGMFVSAGVRMYTGDGNKVGGKDKDPSIGAQIGKDFGGVEGYAAVALNTLNSKYQAESTSAGVGLRVKF